MNDAVARTADSSKILPRLDLQVVITAGNYNRRDQGAPPNRVLTERILPSLHVNPN